MWLIFLYFWHCVHRWSEAADDARTSSGTSSTPAASTSSHGPPSFLAGPDASDCFSVHPTHDCCASGESSKTCSVGMTFTPWCWSAVPGEGVGRTEWRLPCLVQKNRCLVYVHELHAPTSAEVGLRSVDPQQVFSSAMQGTAGVRNLEGCVCTHRNSYLM